jgi:hypothetical protein
MLKIETRQRFDSPPDLTLAAMRRRTAGGNPRSCRDDF